MAINEEKVRAFIYDNNNREFSELNREHVMYLEREAEWLKLGKDLISCDKLDMIKIIFQLTETVKSLTKQ